MSTSPDVGGNSITALSKNLPPNHHCTCLIINSTGIMIEGPSGAGKTSLAMGLIQAARQHDIEHQFICDDQALLEVENGELWARAPKSIAGKIEIHGAGISNIDFVEKTKINLVCKMVTQDQIVRHPDNTYCWHLGFKIASIYVPIRHEAQSVRIVLARLGIPI